MPSSTIIDSRLGLPQNVNVTKRSVNVCQPSSSLYFSRRVPGKKNNKSEFSNLDDTQSSLTAYHYFDKLLLDLPRMIWMTRRWESSMTLFARYIRPWYKKNLLHYYE